MHTSRQKPHVVIRGYYYAYLSRRQASERKAVAPTMSFQLFPSLSAAPVGLKLGRSASIPQVLMIVRVLSLWPEKRID